MDDYSKYVEDKSNDEKLIDSIAFFISISNEFDFDVINGMASQRKTEIVDALELLEICSNNLKEALITTITQ